MASTQAVAERRALALGRLRTAADIAQARTALAIGEPASTKDAEIDRIQWIEYAATVLEAINAGAQVVPVADEDAEPEAARAKRKK
jgi:hypothetical protein